MTTKPTQDDQKNERQVHAIFSRINSVDADTPAFLKTRVMAHLSEQKKLQGHLAFWKLLSAGSLFAILVLCFSTFHFYQKNTTDGVTQQAYVIHIEFNQSDETVVARAEVELPADVHFVSSNKQVREERKLRLPVAVKAIGRGKLPFVVSSDSSGEKSIIVRLLNAQDELVREQTMKVKFAKHGDTVPFQ